MATTKANASKKTMGQKWDEPSRPLVQRARVIMFINGLRPSYRFAVMRCFQQRPVVTISVPETVLPENEIVGEISPGVLDFDRRNCVLKDSPWLAALLSRKPAPVVALVRGYHQGQRSCATASRGGTQDCTRPKRKKHRVNPCNAALDASNSCALQAADLFGGGRQM